MPPFNLNVPKAILLAGNTGMLATAGSGTGTVPATFSVDVDDNLAFASSGATAHAQTGDDCGDEDQNQESAQHAVPHVRRK